MITTHQDYYQGLSLPPLPPSTPTSPTSPMYCRYSFKEQEAEKEFRSIIDEIDCHEIQDKLKNAMDKIISSWTDRHDRLLTDFDILDKSKKKLENKYNLQTQHYEKSMREVQFYKMRYEQFMHQQHKSHTNQRRSNTSAMLVSSNASCLSGKSYVTTSSTRSSCSSSSIRNSMSLVDEMIDPTLFYDHHLLLNDSDDDEDSEINLFAIMSKSDSFTLPNSPNMTPILSPLSLKSPIAQDNESMTLLNEPSPSDVIINTTTTQQNSQTDVLQFACGDGFWNTIALGKLNKAEVDNLIRYIK